MKKFFAMLLAICMVAVMLVGCGDTASSSSNGSDTQSNASDYKVALLLPGSANDKSWNQYGYDALMKVKDELGVEVAYSENVTNVDLQQALRDYASQGYDMIIGHTGGFEDDMIKVAADFPDTKFVCIAGSTGNDVNVTSVDTAPWQYGYAYGWMASGISQTGKVGYITANEGTGTQNNLVGSWKDGVKANNPDTQGTVVYLSDSDDVASAREAALAMISAGCDVVMHELNRAAQGVIDVCREKGVYTIGRSAEDVATAPDQVLTYCNFDWGPKYVYLVEQGMSGELEPGFLFFGFNTPEAPGFTFTYDDSNGWNPNVVSEEILAKFKTDVEEMFIADPARSYTPELAAGGTF